MVWLQAVARRLPLLAGLRVADSFARAYARVALASGRSCEPWRVERFPDEVQGLFGADVADRSELVEARLAFLLCRWLVLRAIRAEPTPAARALLPRIDVRGIEHLTSALETGRGAVAISSHFGLPHLLRMVLTHRHIPMITAVAQPRRDTHVHVTGDLWTRARGLLLTREQLARNKIALFLPDYSSGATAQVPFLAASLEVGMGAFHLARVAGSALLPFFLAAERSTRFSLEFFPALRSPRPIARDAILEEMTEFAALYAAYARRYPAQLPYRSPKVRSGRSTLGREA